MRRFSYSYKKPRSHRLRVEEKKLTKKLVKTLVFTVLGVIFFIYIGLPIFIKLIASSATKESSSSQEESNNSILFPPVLDEINEATNSSEIIISGMGEKETEIQIIVNGEESLSVMSDETGRFVAPGVSLESGSNEISAMTITQDKQSNLSNMLYVQYINSPPELEITYPNNGQEFDSDEKEIEIQGTTQPNAEITINERFVIVNQNGDFSYPISLDDGENTFKIRAVDPAGNESTEEIRVKYNS